MAKLSAEKLIEKMQTGRLTAEDLEGMSLEEVNMLHAKASVLDKALDIEDRQERIAERKHKRDEIIQAHKSQQASIDQFNKDVISQQVICRHRKGGKGLEGILNGRDSDYSIIINTYAWGAVEVICTRCGKEWKKPRPELKRKSPREYARQMNDYQEALRLPTDNEPSGSQLFTFTQENPSAVAEAMA